MKKNRYSKPERKEVPSRRKLAMEAKRLQVIAAQQQHEKHWLELDLETSRDARRIWERMAQTMWVEMERLRKQMDDMLPSDRFVQVSARVIKPEEMMARHVSFNPCQVVVCANVDIRRFQRRDCGSLGNQAFVRAVVDQLCRRVREKLEVELRLVGG